jgi:hypothetical protein
MQTQISMGPSGRNTDISAMVTRRRLSLPVKLPTLHAISAAMVMDGEICLGLRKKKPHDILMDYGQRTMIWRQSRMKVTSDEGGGDAVKKGG